ncbi:MAG: DsrE family protein [Gemmatimonadota bacterium]|nr:DsrE family protein [Gemmatimonadota bacterium]
MKTRFLLLAFAALAGRSSTAAAQQPAGFWTTPAIKDIGPVHVWPQAVLRPDAKTTYKAVFDLTKGAGTDEKMNAGLDHVARTVNVFAAAGVPTSHLRFAVIIHGPATPLALSDSAYQAKFGRPNPNDAVIDALTKAGVKIMVCGNALGDMQFTPEQVNPKIKVALSALSTLIILQDQGYALLTM